MAIFKLGAMFDAISGKVGGQSLCNYSQQQILKNITYTNASPSIKQSKQRALTAALSNSWRFLTQAQRDAWTSTSTNYTYVNRVGETITRNGYQTFCFVNQNLSLLGVSPIDNAPVYVPVSEPKINIIDISSGNFEIQSNNVSSDYYYALFGVANLSQGQKPQSGMMRFLGYITSAQLTSGYDVISDLENVFGTLSFPNNIGIIVDPINNTTGNRKQFVDIIQNVDTPMILEVTLSAATSVTIPFASGGTYSGSINWGDGTITTFAAYNAAGCTHSYSAAGVFTILVFGAFPKFNVNNGTFKSYLTNIYQFGSNQFTQFNVFGCTLLTHVQAGDTPTFIATTSLANCLRGCTNITEFDNFENWEISKANTLNAAFKDTNFNLPVSNWNVINITNLNSAFDSNSVFNQDLSSWNVAKVTVFTKCLYHCSVFNQDLSSWVISAATVMTNFANTCAFSNTNWDAMLIAWAALGTIPSGISISINATHTAAANAAYTTLTTTYTWTINEGV